MLASRLATLLSLSPKTMFLNLLTGNPFSVGIPLSINLS
jgi:hypothetical protein